MLQGKKHHISKGQSLHMEGVMVFGVITSGYVKRYLITDDGSESIQSIYGPDDMFPLTPVYKELIGLDLYKGEEVLYYSAMTDVVMYSISKDKLVQSVTENPELYKDLFYVAGIRLNSNIQRLENSSLKTANRKVIDMILYYAERFGKKTENGAELQLPLTHQTIANMLNIARETVSNVMVRLQERGLVLQQSRFRIAIPELDALRQARH